MEASQTAIAVQPKSIAVEEFELFQRQAAMFATSPLVPEHLRKGQPKEAIANCYIALVMAKEMGESPLVVMQSIYIVHGRAGWSASYMIARANKSGIFRGRITPHYTGDKATRACTARAVLASTGEPVEFTVPMEMAAAEGWTKNIKYKTMPDLMLFYRAATLLIRTICPEVMLGYHSIEEVQDVVASTARIEPALSIAAVVADEPEEESAEPETVLHTEGRLFGNGNTNPMPD